MKNTTAPASGTTFHGVDLGRIEDAVRAAERGTRGEIRVALSRFYFWGDVTRAAWRAFARLHMDRTREGSGVLIFLAPWRRRFAIIGDAGVAERVDPAFWDAVACSLGVDLRGGDVNGGLERAIAAVGAQLAACFPLDAGGEPQADGDQRGESNPPRVNQLPDSVARDQN